MGLLLNLVWYEAKKKRKNKTWHNKNNSAILDAIFVLSICISLIVAVFFFFVCFYMATVAEPKFCIKSALLNLVWIFFFCFETINRDEQYVSMDFCSDNG